VGDFPAKGTSGIRERPPRFHKHPARGFSDNPPDPARIAPFGTAPYDLKHGIHLKPLFRCRLPLAPADFSTRSVEH
jgi:hypothetical protein